MSNPTRLMDNHGRTYMSAMEAARAIKAECCIPFTESVIADHIKRASFDHGRIYAGRTWQQLHCKVVADGEVGGRWRRDSNGRFIWDGRVRNA